MIVALVHLTDFLNLTLVIAKIGFNRPTVKSILWLFCTELRYLVFQRIQHADFSFPENFNIEAHAKNTSM